MMIASSSDKFQFSRYSMSHATRLAISAPFRASPRNPRTCARTGVSTKAAQRSEAGEAGSHERADVMVRHVFGKLLVVFDQMRSWTNDAHVAAEDVPKLRHFIDAEFAEPFT